jgi:hypothetical protein
MRPVPLPLIVANHMAIEPMRRSVRLAIDHRPAHGQAVETAIGAE